MMGIGDMIRTRARQLLADGEVDCVVGYETGSDAVNARPYFAYRPDDAARLVFDPTCTHNLVKYLAGPERRGKRIAIVVKPCDARALNVLLEEKQFSRDRVYAIGVACEGMVQRTRDGGDGITPQARCAVCDQHTPVIHDFLAGEPAAEPIVPDRFPRLRPFEGRNAAEQRAFWAGEFERCIRCYACRQACPQCYCTECFAESLDPEWVGPRIATAENWMFHTIRAFHLTGRCVGCDECERVCPVHIPLGLLNGKLRQGVEERFDYRAGMSADEPPPLETFRKEEKLGGG